MTIPILNRLVKAFSGDPTLLDVELPRITVTGDVALTDGAHWGRVVEGTGTCQLNTTLSDRFWCFFRNVSTTSVSLASTDSLKIVGPATIDADEVVLVIKGASGALIVAVNADASTRAPFPPSNFVTTSSTVTPSANNAGTVYIFQDTGELNLPPAAGMQVGEYFGAINENTVADTAIFVSPNGTDVISNEIGDDALLPGAGALYIYRGAGTWQRFLDVEEQLVPPWPVSINLGANANPPLVISAATWASTYGNTTITGDSLGITLPTITDAGVAEGSGIRLVATGTEGLPITVANTGTETIQGLGTSTTISQGNELILFKRDGTSTEWRVFYNGSARAVGQAQVTRITSGVSSILNLAGVVDENEVNTNWQRIGFLRRFNISDDEQAIFDEVTVSRNNIPTNTLTNIAVKAGGQRSNVILYNLTAIPAVAGTYYALFDSPNEVTSVTSDGVGAVISFEKVDTAIRGKNEYRVIITNPGAGATAITVTGGPRPIAHLALSDRFTLDGRDIISNTIDFEQLSNKVTERIPALTERNDIRVLHENIVNINNTTRIDRNPKIQVRGAWFFEEPTADAGTFPTNKAPTTADITVANASTAATRLADASTTQQTNSQLTGPSLRNGGFDIVPTNGVLDLTTNLQGIILGFAIDTNILGNASEDIFSIAGTDVALIVDQNHRLGIRMPRAGTGATTTTRRVTTPIPDDQGRETVFFTATARSDSFELPSVFTDPLTGQNSAEVEFIVFENGSLVGGPQAFLDIPSLTTDVAEITQTIQAGGVTNGPSLGRISYTGATRRINVSVDAWTNVAATVRIRVKGRREETVNIDAGSTNYTLEYIITNARRYSIFVHLFKENDALEVQLAINGTNPNEAITRIAHANPTGAAFQNPTIQIGGASHAYNAFIQKIIVGQALPFTTTTRLSNAELAAISGQYEQEFFGLVSSAAAERQLRAPGIVWQVAINNGNALGAVSNVETFTTSLEDDFGRPGLPAFTSDDIANGKYVFRVLVAETISANSHLADLSWHELGLVNGQADHRILYLGTIANPADNELVVSGNQIRLDHVTISTNAAFNAQTITAQLQIVLK